MSGGDDVTANSRPKCDHCGEVIGAGARWCTTCMKATCACCALENHRDLQHQLQIYYDANNQAQKQRQQTATQLKTEANELKCVTQKCEMEVKEVTDRAQSLSAAATTQLEMVDAMLTSYEMLMEQPLSNKSYDNDGRMTKELQQRLVAVRQMSTDVDQLLTKWMAALPSK